MKNKEFKKGVAIGVAATLVVTGAGFVSYQKVLFPKGNALSDMKTVQKLNYLEELIDEEYLDEKDESSLREVIWELRRLILQQKRSRCIICRQVLSLHR